MLQTTLNGYCLDGFYIREVTRVVARSFIISGETGYSASVSFEAKAECIEVGDIILARVKTDDKKLFATPISADDPPIGINVLESESANALKAPAGTFKIAPIVIQSATHGFMRQIIAGAGRLLEFDAREPALVKADSSIAATTSAATLAELRESTAQASAHVAELVDPHVVYLRAAFSAAISDEPAADLLAAESEESIALPDGTFYLLDTGDVKPLLYRATPRDDMHAASALAMNPRDIIAVRLKECHRFMLLLQRLGSAYNATMLHKNSLLWRLILGKRYKPIGAPETPTS